MLIAAACGAYFIWGGKTTTSVKFKTAKVEKRDIIRTVEANGTVEPEDLVDVGARVSGEIISFGKDIDGHEVDYGSRIKKGEIIALIDPKIPQTNLDTAKATLKGAQATLAQAKADLTVSKTNLLQAERDWSRAKRLGASEALSQAAYDSYLSAWEKATAQIAVSEAKVVQAEASVAQAKAALETAERNLAYCTIKAPVDGVVIDRIVNVGQTVVSSMNASSLFLIAKDLKRMEVWASVNEADIGSIKQGQDVSFTVEAFPNEKFVGKVGKIRLNATMSQNVVTYIVEVVTDNSSLRLLPYLTANLSFEVERINNALSVPNSALRWKPAQEQIAKDIEVPRGRKIWVKKGNFVRPISVKVLLNDGSASAIESADIKDGMEIVTGIETTASLEKAVSANTNPLMPKMPQRKKSTNSAKAAEAK